MPRDEFQVSRYIKMVPDFTDKEVEKYFPHFERVAITLEWPKQYWTLLLQCALKGRAQEVYSVLPLEDSADYDKVKAAILNAYQLVPEAYRQKFRHYKRTDRQTYVEFAAEKSTLFDRWCQSEGVNSMGKLKELILVEDFRNCLPDNVSTYVAEQKAETISQAACLADQYALTHRVYKDRNCFKSQSTAFNYFYKTPRPFDSRVQSPSDSKSPSVPVETEQKFCNYCKTPGHLKSDCGKLKKRQEKSVGLVTTARQNSISLKPVGAALVKAPSTYEPFLTDGVISVADGQSVPVRILRDTGAAQSFMLRDLLPLSEKTATGSSVLVQGIEMGFIRVPLHRVCLKSELVSGEVVVGVRSSFPIPSVNFILGNNIAGPNVWSRGEVLPEVIAAPPVPVGVDDYAQNFPDVFPASVVTRAQSKKRTSITPVDLDLSDSFVAQPEKCDRLFEKLQQSVPKVKIIQNNTANISLSRVKLISLQKSDPTLVSCFQAALSDPGRAPNYVTAETEHKRDNKKGSKSRGFINRKWSYLTKLGKQLCQKDK